LEYRDRTLQFVETRGGRGNVIGEEGIQTLITEGEERSESRREGTRQNVRSRGRRKLILLLLLLLLLLRVRFSRAILRLRLLMVMMMTVGVMRRRGLRQLLLLLE